MNNEQIQELKRLAEDATPGEWVAAGRAVHTEDDSVYGIADCSEARPGTNWSGTNYATEARRQSNAAWIAATSPAAVLELIAMVEAGNPASVATPAAASAGGAGTIDTPPAFNDAMHGAFSAIRNDVDRADMEAIWEGMWRAATAPVSAVPADERVIETLRSIACQSVGSDWTHEQAFTYCREAARMAIASLSAGAPVSAADLPAWKIGYEANPNAMPAGGQERPALTAWTDDEILAVSEEYDAGRNMQGRRMFSDSKLVEFVRFMAMRQAQGEAEMRALIIEALDAGDLVYELGTDLCARMIAAVRRGGPLPDNLVSWAAAVEAMDAKQAGKESQ